MMLTICGFVACALMLSSCAGSERQTGVIRMEDGVMLVDLREPTPIGDFTDDGGNAYTIIPEGPVRVLLPAVDVELEADTILLESPLDGYDYSERGAHVNANPINYVEFSVSAPADVDVMWSRVDAAIDVFGVDPESEVKLNEIRHHLETTSPNEVGDSNNYVSKIRATDEYEAFAAIDRFTDGTFRTRIGVTFFNGVYGSVPQWPLPSTSSATMVE